MRAITAAYLALEHVRLFRRLLVVRCGLIAIALAVVGAGWHALPSVACWFGVGLFLLVPLGAWMFELRRERELARHLECVPDSVTRSVSTDAS